MIKVQDISCGYGPQNVLEGIRFDVQAGEMVGVLGPNGSGKSTLLLALSGVLPLRAGEIRLNGQSLCSLSAKEQARHMASVPQRLTSAFDLKVLSVVLMGRYPYISFLGGYRDRDREIALAAMDQTRTLPFKDRLTGELSGGEFQRVLIARALTQETDVLLLDEASSGLDIARKIEIYDLLKEKNRQGVTILSVIHDLNLAALYCTRMLFLKCGRLVLDGPPDSVFTEKNLADIYETPITVAPHPVTGAPQAHLVPGPGPRPGDGSDRQR